MCAPSCHPGDCRYRRNTDHLRQRSHCRNAFPYCHNPGPVPIQFLHFSRRSGLWKIHGTNISVHGPHPMGTTDKTDARPRYATQIRWDRWKDRLPAVHDMSDDKLILICAHKDPGSHPDCEERGNVPRGSTLSFTSSSKLCFSVIIKHIITCSGTLLRSYLRFHIGKPGSARTETLCTEP